jgi:hypothetical protein
MINNKRLGKISDIGLLNFFVKKMRIVDFDIVEKRIRGDFASFLNYEARLQISDLKTQTSG